jgi:hypothetical protein
LLFGGGSSGHSRPVEQLRPTKTKSKKNAEVAKKLAELQSLRDQLRAQVQEQLLLKQLELKKEELQRQILALGGTIEDTKEACGAQGNL